MVNGSPPKPASTEECVVPLHGLARSDASMEKVAVEHTEAGDRVLNHGYPSLFAEEGNTMSPRA